MFMLISPAKTLDFETTVPVAECSQPQFLESSQQLIDRARKLSAEDIAALMKISEKLSILNYERFHDWETPFTPDNARQALYAFKGDVYTGLDAYSLDSDSALWANEHLGILSGLYGLLRPLDLIQAYRLEMGTKLDTDKGKNLYEFWGEHITNAINTTLSEREHPLLVNLASNEYYSVIQPQSIAARIITPIFKDEKNGKYKIISFYAKKARGIMARWIIENRITQAQDLKNFTVDGYSFDAEASTDNDWVFTRPEQ